VKLIRQSDRVKARSENTIPAGSSRFSTKDRTKKRSKVPRIRDPLSLYIHLKCGHVTTMEEIERYFAWQPKPGKYFCDNCGKWREQEIYVCAEIPPDPLF
jgi:hypothetical protein